jgi:hypothetical protein
LLIVDGGLLIVDCAAGATDNRQSCQRAIHSTIDNRQSTISNPLFCPMSSPADFDSGFGIADPRALRDVRRFSHEAMNTVF